MKIAADNQELLTETFLYGFPLVFNLEQVTRYVAEGVGGNPAAPFNTFSHARKLAGPADTFVTINNDTVYSMAQLDLSVGPVALHVPDTDGRYYVATRTGVQIFLPDGTAVGTIWAPQYPVSITFGGPDNDVLYMVGESSVWSIQTRVRGFRHPSGMN